jgi:hypothetical protein
MKTQIAPVIFRAAHAVSFTISLQVFIARRNGAT